MLLYKNHRFHSKGGSFQLPDGYVIDSITEDDTVIFIPIYAPDRSLFIDIRFEKTINAVLVALPRMLEDFVQTIINPVTPLMMNDLTGCHVTYQRSRTQGYEAWFDLDAGYALTIEFRTHGNILDIDTAALLAEIDPRADGN